MRRRGQAAIEYGLLIALIALLTLLGANALGSAVRQWFDALAGRITANS